MRKYARGKLPNTKGETLDDQKKMLPVLKGGKIQQATGTVTLGPTVFRCISGLEPEEVLTLQKCLLDKTIILKKGKHTKDMVDMEEFAWGFKVDRVLKSAIIDFFNDLTRERLTWDQVCEEYKLGDYEYNQLKSYTQGFVKDCLNRTKKNPSLPKSAVRLLHHLYRASTGEVTKDTSCPWTIKGVGLDMHKLESFCQLYHVPFQLAIMDARGFQENLSVDIFSSLTNCLNIMNSQMEYIFVCFVDFVHIAYLVEGVRSQAGKVHYEVGTISKENELSLTRGIAAYASVVLFVSKGSNFESIDKTPGEKAFISTTASTRGDTIDMDFISYLIERFSPQQNYVLDLFSGGVVLQQSLMSKRRCIAVCRDDLEAMVLMTKCSQIVEDNPQIQEWCGAEVSLLEKQTIEFNDAKRDALDNIQVDEQPSGDEEDEEEDNENKEHSSSSTEDEENEKESQQKSGGDEEKEKSGAEEGNENKDKEDEEENQQKHGGDEEKEQSGAEECNNNKDKEKDKESVYACQSNDEKRNDDTDESSKIGSLET